MADAKKVLIVDDDVVFADFVRATVESVGHRAVVVTQGAEALAAFREHRPDLVMLDILLPGSDGFQICQQLRETPAGQAVPIVLMTGIYKKASYERQGLKDCGATEYVHKPFGVQCLWRMLETYLGAVTGDAEPETPPESFDLSETPLVEVLKSHVDSNSNGVLFVRSRGVTYAVYLQWGDPVFIRSNDPADRLHEVLKRSGQVTPEQVQGALQAVAESKGRLRLGQALVRRGVLDEEQFQVSLQLQLRLIFQKAFALCEGTCSFIPGSHPTEEDVLLAIRPAALMLLGSKTASRHPKVRASLPQSETPLLRGGTFATLQGELSLKPHERALAQLADGTLSAGRFQAIAACAGCDGAALLHAFLLTGLFEAGDAPADPDRRPQATEWDAARFASLPVAAALADLHRCGASGTLEVRASRSGPAKRLVFRRGSITAVQSDVEEDRLDEMLVRLKLISESQLEELLSSFGDVEPDDRQLARALSTSGHVLPLQVYWAAVYQAQGAVHGLFGLTGARLTWRGGEVPEDAVELPDLPTQEIVLAAVRSLPDAALMALLPTKTTWLRARDDAARRLSGMPLTEEERALLARLSEPAELRQLLAAPAAQRREQRARVLGLMVTQLACETAAPTVAESDTNAAFEAVSEEGADFLDLLHEEGFESGVTGRQGAIEEPAEPDAAAEGAGEEGADELFSFDFAEQDAGEPAAGAGEEPGPDLETRCRELLGRLAAGRAALDEPGEALEAHRTALEGLLAACEDLARAVLDESGAKQGDREPASIGGRR